MDLDKIIEEVYEKGGGGYGAYSEPPRKDFAPVSMKGGYDNAYQQSGSVGQFTEPPPQAPIVLPWPMQTVYDDLGDGFVMIMSAANKMVQCVNVNPSLTDDQKDSLVDFYKKLKQALDLIKSVGSHLGVSNIAGSQPSQNPVPAPVNPAPETMPQKGNNIIIKLP
jgi:hypothetical protein